MTIYDLESGGRGRRDIDQWWASVEREGDAPKDGQVEEWV